MTLPARAIGELDHVERPTVPAGATELVRGYVSTR